MYNGPHKIMIVDDEHDMLNVLSDLLSKKGYTVHIVDNGSKAEKLIAKHFFNIVLTDLNMPKMNGIELLKRIKKISADTEVIVITGYGTIESAVDAVKEGAYDYITKPINNDYLLLIIDRILQHKDIKAQNQYLQSELDIRYNFDNIIGNSPQMKRVFQLIKDVAPTQSTVLIRGESGTGKELIANAIHYNSLRKDKRIVRVNCAVLAENLLETELFGHMRGAFTGAHRDRIGRFELANSGTIFLDELGDISTSLQLKLLRVLQEREILRIGENIPRRVDIRIDAATNTDLATAVAEGHFRKDLYFRLRVVEIRVPTLAERVDDILVLAGHFLAELSIRMNLPHLKLDEECHPYLLKYAWPGNVRELYNVMERAAIFGRGRTIRVEHLPPELIRPPESIGAGRAEPMCLREMEAAHIWKVLQFTAGNRPKAAKILGISQSTLWRKLKEL